MTAVEAGLAELAEYGVNDSWAAALVESAAFYHLAGNAPCIGYTSASSGRALCGNCGWQLSGRLDDRGEERSARFVLFALAAIGEAVACWVTASKLDIEQQLLLAQSLA